MLANTSTPATAAGAKISTTRRRTSEPDASIMASSTDTASCRYWLQFSENTSASSM